MSAPPDRAMNHSTELEKPCRASDHALLKPVGGGAGSAAALGVFTGRGFSERVTASDENDAWFESRLIWPW